MPHHVARRGSFVSSPFSSSCPCRFALPWRRTWDSRVRRPDGSALPLNWPKKQWVVLDSSAKLSFYENRRTAKPNRVQPLKGGECKTPILTLRGETLKQPPVIASYIADSKFPLTLTWPQKQIDHDLVLAATTSEERSKWVKALNKTLKALREAAPTAGWLVKQGGRARTGFMTLFASNKR